VKQFSPANWGKKLPEWLEQPPTRVDGSRTMVSGLQALTITGMEGTTQHREKVETENRLCLDCFTPFVMTRVPSSATVRAMDQYYVHSSDTTTNLESLELGEAHNYTHAFESGENGPTLSRGKRNAPKKLSSSQIGSTSRKFIHK
jgi:hypothetical protein